MPLNRDNNEKDKKDVETARKVDKGRKEENLFKTQKKIKPVKKSNQKPEQN